MDATTLAARANSAAAAQRPSASPGTAGASPLLSGDNAITKLGQNFTEFLQLLLTQVQNQDPTSPTDTSQFTSELVQFTGVQQQVATNAHLGQLITLQGANMVLQSGDLIGHPATVSATSIALQSGSGTLSFTGHAGQQAAIGIVDGRGRVVRDAIVTETDGKNTWVWDGKDNAGNPVPDGAYRTAVLNDTGSGGAPTALPFLVTGITTGVTTSGTSTQLQLGALSVDIGALQSVSR